MIIYTGKVICYNKDENASPDYYNELIYWNNEYSTDWRDFISIKKDHTSTLQKSTKWQDVKKI